MRTFDLTYSTVGNRVTFEALNDNGKDALWDVLSLLGDVSNVKGYVHTVQLSDALVTLKRKGYTVRNASNKNRSR